MQKPSDKWFAPKSEVDMELDTLQNKTLFETEIDALRAQVARYSNQIEKMRMDNHQLARQVQESRLRLQIEQERYDQIIEKLVAK